jgi:hypothetical protein
MDADTLHRDVGLLTSITDACGRSARAHLTSAPAQPGAGKLAYGSVVSERVPARLRTLLKAALSQGVRLSFSPSALAAFKRNQSRAVAQGALLAWTVGFAAHDAVPAGVAGDAASAVAEHARETRALAEEAAALLESHRSSADKAGAVKYPVPPSRVPSACTVTVDDVAGALPLSVALHGLLGRGAHTVSLEGVAAALQAARRAAPADTDAPTPGESADVDSEGVAAAKPPRGPLAQLQSATALRQAADAARAVEAEAPAASEVDSTATAPLAPSPPPLAASLGVCPCMRLATVTRRPPPAADAPAPAPLVTAGPPLAGAPIFGPPPLARPHRHTLAPYAAAYAALTCPCASAPASASPAARLEALLSAPLTAFARIPSPANRPQFLLLPLHAPLALCLAHPLLPVLDYPRVALVLRHQLPLYLAHTVAVAGDAQDVGATPEEAARRGRWVREAMGAAAAVVQAACPEVGLGEDVIGGIEAANDVRLNAPENPMLKDLPPMDLGDLGDDDDDDELDVLDEYNDLDQCCF